MADKLEKMVADTRQEMKVDDNIEDLVKKLDEYLRTKGESAAPADRKRWSSPSAACCKPVTAPLWYGRLSLGCVTISNIMSMKSIRLSAESAQISSKPRRAKETSFAHFLHQYTRVRKRIFQRLSSRIQTLLWATERNAGKNSWRSTRRYRN